MKTVVIIPIYRSKPTDNDCRAILNNTAILSAHDIAFVAPMSMDVSEYTLLYKSARIVRVSDSWLGSSNGIAGYNEMMLSADFYRLFTNWDYMLVCHTDAWVFRDAIDEWTLHEYSCVAAPWIRRKVYNLPIIKQYMSLRTYFKHLRGERCRADIYGHIGNGGLSLRHIASFIEQCEQNNSLIEKYKNSDHHLYNEDVFWALEPKNFKYPTENEALHFAFDTNPAYCYKMIKGQLPMGCHSWSKPKMWHFWKNIIR